MRSTNRKRTLMISASVILLCMAVIMGMTWALFTDTQKIDNHLQAGDLDVTLKRIGLKKTTLTSTGYLDEDKVVRYRYSEWEYRDPVYVPMGAFITSYCRERTIRSGQANYDRFIYSDTDSLKLLGYEEPDNLEVHPTRLGAWKDEGDFSDSKWRRAKTYLLTVDGELKVTCAGMPDNVKEQVTYENFHSGSTFDGKLMPRRYPGGIVLEPTTFTIK